MCRGVITTERGSESMSTVLPMCGLLLVTWKSFFWLVQRNIRFQLSQVSEVNSTRASQSSAGTSIASKSSISKRQASIKLFYPTSLSPSCDSLSAPLYQKAGRIVQNQTLWVERIANSFFDRGLNLISMNSFLCLSLCSSVMRNCLFSRSQMEMLKSGRPPIITRQVPQREKAIPWHFKVVFILKSATSFLPGIQKT